MQAPLEVGRSAHKNHIDKAFLVGMLLELVSKKLLKRSRPLTGQVFACAVGYPYTGQSTHVFVP